LARQTPKPPFEKLLNSPAKALEYKTNLSNERLFWTAVTFL
jgi:hypothetical protein